jgi:multidrug transporter EmrE-like cation transporter
MIRIVYIIIITIALIEAISQYCLKKGNIENNKYLYLIGIIGYFFISFLLIKSYNYGSLSQCNFIWSSLSIIFACINGKIFFGEKINYLACLFILSAIYLINRNK